ncbi:unnamed protein product [Rhizoctonia solani]|uniref:CHAT domain-containing protein n=1 Tax=Rhizoctonia solani TaxID=456999 RepID=A0A8H3HZF5_9AGAM|nr:unnamed protein product [Rhizoctonia solani]
MRHNLFLAPVYPKSRPASITVIFIEKLPKDSTQDMTPPVVASPEGSSDEICPENNQSMLVTQGESQKWTQDIQHHLGTVLQLINTNHPDRFTLIDLELTALTDQIQKNASITPAEVQICLKYLTKLSGASDGARGFIRINRPRRPSHLPGLLNNIATSHESRFRIAGDNKDFDMAIACYTHAMHLTPGGQHDILRLANKLGNLHSTRFQRFDSAIDIEKAIQYYAKGVTLLNDRHPHMPSQLVRLGMAYKAAFQRQGNVEHIDQTITFLTKALSLTAQDDPNRPIILSNLGSSFRSRSESTGDLTNLGRAIECQIQATSIVSDGHPIKGSLLNNLGTSYLSRYKRLGELEELNKSVDSLKKAALLMPKSDPSIPRLLCNLGEALRIRFRKIGKKDDIDQSFELLTRAIRSVPEGHPELATLFNNIGSSYLTRFESFGNPEDIDHAIKNHTQSLLITPKGHPDIPRLLSGLGSSHRFRFERLGLMDDLDQAIKFQEQAVELTPLNNPSAYRNLNNLGVAYLSRYKSCANLNDIDQAIKLFSSAVPGMPSGHPAAPEILCNLGTSYMTRFDRLGNLEDINQSITYHTQALSLTSKGHSGRAQQLSNTGNAHSARFDRSGRLEDLDRAIELLTLAALLISDDHPDMPALLGNLGRSYNTRFGLHGQLEDIDGAIECLQEALSHEPDNHPRLPLVLRTLAAAYSARFVRLGNLEDIDKAIGYTIRAIAVLPHNHVEAPSLLLTLGDSYEARFDRLRQPGDIERAIHFMKQAMLLSPDDHVERPTRIGVLGTAYYERYRALQELEDIEHAINYQSQAMLLCPVDHPAAPFILNDLGISHRLRFDRLKLPEDIDEAIRYQHKAVSLRSTYRPDHGPTPSLLINLSVSYQVRFAHYNNEEDADKSIEFLTQAASLLPDYHANLPALLNALAHVHLTVAISPGRHSHTDNAIRLFEKSANLPFGYPRPKLDSAKNWARAASDSKVNPIDAYKRAMELVPQMVWLGATIEQRYNDVMAIGELAVEAAGAAICAREYDLALEWLEQGRSVVWNQILKLRTPLNELYAVNPSLANRLKNVSNELHMAGSRLDPIFRSDPSSDNSSLEQAAQRHRRLAEEYELLINQAHRMPGCQNLLRPREASSLIRAARDGPVVVINVDKSRCDALLIQPNIIQVTHVALPNLTYAKIVKAQIQMDVLLHAHDVRQRDISRRPMQGQPDDTQGGDFKQILEDLWVNLVEPVVTALRILDAPLVDNQLPHITWCTTGPLSFLPIHASGCYMRPGPKLFDLAISSYVPSVSALLSSAPIPNSTQPRILAIGQEATPGHNPLPGTKQELECIRNHAPKKSTYTQLEGHAATTEAVFNAMEQHEWLHLACHAHQSTNDPTDSGFFLYDGILDLKRISQKGYSAKELAFLSACQTATGDKKLVDETVHMAAGLLMAGYPTVVATMWSVMDVDAPLIADNFYQSMLGSPKPDHKQAARALHASVRLLRENVGEEQFVRWLPYVHFGV